MKIMSFIIIAFASGIIISSCMQNNKSADPPAEDTTVKTGHQGNGTAWAGGSFKSNGERIYFTSTSDSGTDISYTGGPEMGMMMMGGRYACVSCHGTDANGGHHVMHMEIMDSPGIRWSTLTRMKRKELGKDENDKSIDAYTFEDFKKEVIDHKELDGDELKDGMPKWNMSNTDLEDLMNYLKSFH